MKDDERFFKLLGERMGRRDCVRCLLKGWLRGLVRGRVNCELWTVVCIGAESLLLSGNTVRRSEIFCQKFHHPGSCEQRKYFAYGTF